MSDSLGSLVVVHALPGRIRLRMADANGAANRIRDELQLIPGVRSVEMNEVTGSLLVHYNPAEFDPGGHLSLVPVPTPAPTVSAPPLRIERAPSSEIAQSLSGWLWRTDAAIHEATGGKADLKLLAPAGLMMAGFWELLTGTAVAGATLHTLAWYAYNLFYQMHPREMQGQA